MILVDGEPPRSGSSSCSSGFSAAVHAKLAAGFAKQAAGAIETERLFQQARDKAALEERQRLARGAT